VYPSEVQGYWLGRAHRISRQCGQRAIVTQYAAGFKDIYDCGGCLFLQIGQHCGSSCATMRDWIIRPTIAHRAHDFLSEQFSEEGNESDDTMSDLSQLEYNPPIEPGTTR
jgi:hypothetical protein